MTPAPGMKSTMLSSAASVLVYSVVPPLGQGIWDYAKQLWVKPNSQTEEEDEEDEEDEYGPNPVRRAIAELLLERALGDFDLDK